MDYNAMTNGEKQVLLVLTLPSGRTCRAKVHRNNTGQELIDALVEQGLIAPGRYEFLTVQGVCEEPCEPLGALFAPGADQACARLRELPEDWPPDYSRMQVLYGCPTAVTQQAERLRDCTVTKTEL